MALLIKLTKLGHRGFSPFLGGGLLQPGMSAPATSGSATGCIGLTATASASKGAANSATGSIGLTAAESGVKHGIAEAVGTVGLNATAAARKDAAGNAQSAVGLTATETSLKNGSGQVAGAAGTSAAVAGNSNNIIELYGFADGVIGLTGFAQGDAAYIVLPGEWSPASLPIRRRQPKQGEAIGTLGLAGSVSGAMILTHRPDARRRKEELMLAA